MVLVLIPRRNSLLCGDCFESFFGAIVSSLALAGAATKLLVPHKYVTQWPKDPNRALKGIILHTLRVQVVGMLSKPQL